MTIMTTTFVTLRREAANHRADRGRAVRQRGLVAFSAYVIGVLAIVVSGIMLKKFRMFAGEPAPFVMELPAYHTPTLVNVLRSMWERGWSFIKKAGTIILLSTIVLWFLQGYGWENGAFGAVENIDNCILAGIGNALCTDLCAAWLGKLAEQWWQPSPAGSPRRTSSPPLDRPRLCRGRGRWRGNLGQPAGFLHRGQRVFVHVLQPALRTVLRGDGRNQA